MKQFIKEWGPFILFLIALGLVRLFLIQPVSVDGHSMDPTLADGERLIVLRTAKIDRFDIVVRKKKAAKPKKSLNVLSDSQVIPLPIKMMFFTSTVKRQVNLTWTSTKKLLKMMIYKTFTLTTPYSNN